MTLGPVQIHIDNDQIAFKLPPGFNAALFVKGALQAEYCLGVHGPEDLRAELVKARSSVAACMMMSRVLAEMLEQTSKPDHVVKSHQRPAAFAAGLEAGVRGEHRVIGRDLESGFKGTVVPPEHALGGPSFERGWWLGSALHAALAMSRGEPDPRRAWGDPRPAPARPAPAPQPPRGGASAAMDI